MPFRGAVVSTTIVLSGTLLFVKSENKTKPERKYMPVSIGVSQLLTSVKPDEIVPMLKGVVLKTYDRKMFAKRNPKEGEDPNGSIQRITIGDVGNPDESVYVKLWGKKPLSSSDVGREITFIANQSNGRISGLRFKEEEYQGEVTHFLDVGERAEVVFNDRPVEQQNSDRTNQAQAPVPKARPAATSARTGQTWKDIGTALDRYGCLYSVCFAQVMNRIVPEIEKRTNIVEMQDEDVREIATTMFIELSRKGYAPPENLIKGYGSAKVGSDKKSYVSQPEEEDVTQLQDEYVTEPGEDEVPF